MKNEKLSLKEKLTQSINKTSISEPTKEAIRQIMELKDRTEQQITRYALDAMVKRFTEGKIKDEELY